VLGDIGHPQLVRFAAGELAVDQVSGDLVRLGVAPLRAPSRAGEPCAAHQHRHRAVADHDPAAIPDRGPLLIISGEKDHTVPWAIANASYKQQQENRGVTEIVEIKDRGHALTIDHGWREVANTALAFVKRFA
jgi:pimeloyl-ACP methyl ester carboxylesterase